MLNKPETDANVYLASSVDCERAFSLAGRIVSPMRASVGDQNIRASVLLNSWMSVPGLVAEDEFKERLIEGWNKPGKRLPDNNSNDVIEIS
jgi:hypothetical protein